MCCVACTSEQNSKVNINVVRADSLLNQVLALYEVKEYHYICNQITKFTSMETDINRLKVVLAEKKRTNKWLCEQLNVNPSTVSKWCTNSSQPDLETLVKISHLLDVELGDLVNKKFIDSQQINQASDL